jgi:hypothetical protein
MREAGLPRRKDPRDQAAEEEERRERKIGKSCDELGERGQAGRQRTSRQPVLPNAIESEV